MTSGGSEGAGSVQTTLLSLERPLSSARAAEGTASSGISTSTSTCHVTRNFIFAALRSLVAGLALALHFVGGASPEFLHLDANFGANLGLCDASINPVQRQSKLIAKVAGYLNRDHPLASAELRPLMFGAINHAAKIGSRHG